MSSTTAMSSKNNVLFIFGDGRLGYQMVNGMCLYLEKHHGSLNSFTAVVDKHFKDEMKDIEQGKICSVEAVDLSDEKQAPQQVQKIMEKHQVNWLVLLACGDSFNGPESVKWTLETFKKHGGENVISLSVAKCDESECEVMKKCHEVEKQVYHSFPKTSVILRSQLPFLSLDYFLDCVKNDKAWRLPMGKGKAAPLGWLPDVACAIATIAMQERVKPQIGGKMLTLTGKDVIAGSDLADLTKKSFNEDIKFEEISIDEARKVLDQYQERQSGEGGGKMRLRRGLLNKHERDGTLAMFELIQKGKYDFTTDDLSKVNGGKDAMSAEDYLRMREKKLRG